MRSRSRQAINESKPRSIPLVLDLITEFIIFSERDELMYVCVCRAVTDTAICEVIDAGAETVEAVTEACCAGDDCGACRGAIREMIEDRKRLPIVRAA